MAVVERCVTRTVARVGKRDRDIVAEEIDIADTPASAVPLDGEKALSRRDEDAVAHEIPPRAQPPDSA
jgi:hypothetical protein